MIENMFYNVNALSKYEKDDVYSLNENRWLKEKKLFWKNRGAIFFI